MFPLEHIVSQCIRIRESQTVRLRNTNRHNGSPRKRFCDTHQLRCVDLVITTFSLQKKRYFCVHSLPGLKILVNRPYVLLLNNSCISNSLLSLITFHMTDDWNLHYDPIEFLRKFCIITDILILSFLCNTWNFYVQFVITTYDIQIRTGHFSSKVFSNWFLDDDEILHSSISLLFLSLSCTLI